MDLTKGVPAKVRLETTVNQQGQIERHLFNEYGKLVQMNGAYYIRFQETYQETEIPVTVKIDPAGAVTIIRKGENTNRLRFDKDGRYKTIYKTPQGIIDMTVVTRNIHISYTDQPFSGRVHIDYDLYFGKNKLGEYNLELLFTV